MLIFCSFCKIETFSYHNTSIKNPDFVMNKRIEAQAGARRPEKKAIVAPGKAVLENSYYLKN